MTPNPVVIGAAQSAWAAECLAEERDVHHLIVMDHYDLVGEVCRCDLRAARAGEPVTRCMHSPPVTVEDQQTAEDALGIMAERHVGCLPVVDWMGALHGIVTLRDLRRAGIVSQELAHACAACGATHDLVPVREDEQVMFCRHCVEQCRTPVGATSDVYYYVDGGGD